MSDERHADWTPHPVVEREIANEERVRRKARRWTWTLALGSLGLCPLSFGGLVDGVLAGRELTGLTLAFLGAVGLACAALVRADRQARRERRLQAEFRSEFASVGGWVVEITVFQGATPTVCDWGAVWFEDDRLMFSGRRTSFSLAPSQVRSGMVESRAIHDLNAALSLPLKVRSTVGMLGIGLDVLPPDAPFAPTGQDQRTFLQTTREWLATGGSTAGQLPPLALGPDAPTAWSLLAKAILGTAFWIGALTGFVTLGLSIGWEWAVGTEIVTAIVLAYLPWLCVPRLRWRAWRDRRRLERAQWKT